LEGLELLGNASVVPLVIFLTQIVKKRLPNFKYGTDALALILSLVLCFGWEFYYMSPTAFVSWKAMTGLATFKWGIDQLIAGFATWLAASKIYDLGHGNKKKEAEKEELQKEIVKLKNGSGDKDEQIAEDPVVTDKLRNILEG
jgi:hypothetical protein